MTAVEVDTDTKPVPRMSLREWLLATLVCVLLYPLALRVLSGPRLFDRPFWADEVLSWLIASDADFSHGMSALAGGVDTNAPVLHWTYFLAGSAFGHTPLVYRLVSTLAMSLGLLGAYAALRAYAPRLPSFAGVASLLALPIILSHTTEARFYGFFLAGAAWAGFFIDRRLERPALWNAAMVGFASVYLCGVHYFGILALACLGLFAAGRALPRGLYRAADVLWPTSAGLVMTLCLLPLLRTQREALASAGGTWIPDHFIQNVVTTVSMLLPLGSTCVIGLLMALTAWSMRQRWSHAMTFPSTSLAGLVLLPVVLIAFDRMVQPVLVPRYFIAALLVVAVFVSCCMTVLTPRFQVAATIALFAVFVGDAIQLRSKLTSPEPHTGLGILSQLPREITTIAVDWRGHLLPIWADRPELRNRIVFVDDRRVSHPDLDQSIPFEREMVRIMNRFYGFPKTIAPTELQELDRFLFVTEFPETAQERLGHGFVTQRTPLTWQFERVMDTAEGR